MREEDRWVGSDHRRLARDRTGYRGGTVPAGSPRHRHGPPHRSPQRPHYRRAAAAGRHRPALPRRRDRRSRPDRRAVSNAGETLRAPVESVPLHEVERLFQLNTLGALRVTQAVLPVMRSRGSAMGQRRSPGAAADPRPPGCPGAGEPGNPAGRFRRGHAANQRAAPAARRPGPIFHRRRHRGAQARRGTVRPGAPDRIRGTRWARG